MASRTFSSKPSQTTERCRLPYENATSAYPLAEDTLKKYYPIDPRSKQYAKCHMYNDDNATVACSKYIFDDAIYKTTTIVEWNMVCSRAFMGTVADCGFMLGVMVGSIVFGQLSDRFGRKIVLCGTMIAQFVMGIIIVLNKYYIAFVIARFIMGATVAGGLLTAYVLGTEMVGPRDRIYTGTMCHIFFAIGYMLVALYAYFLRYWRYLVGAITAPGILFFSYWLFVPESPRWLLTRRKTLRAEQLIKRMAVVNGRSLDAKQLRDFLGGGEMSEGDDVGAVERVTVLDIFKYPRLRRRSLIIFVNWFAITISYYGLSWNTSNLGGGDDFLNLFIAGSVELPAYIILLLTLNRWGRKILLCGSMLSAASFLIAIAIIPEHLHWLIITLAMAGKFAVAASFSVIYIFTVEQYPTVIRNAGLGVASTIARTGAILTPFVNTTGEYWRPAPILIYGVLILIAAGLSLTLPETLNKQLPETIEEGENF